MVTAKRRVASPPGGTSMACVHGLVACQLPIGEIS